VMRSELKLVTDFQKQKTSMMRELENVSWYGSTMITWLKKRKSSPLNLQKT
jgi:hypothetical protein